MAITETTSLQHWNYFLTLEDDIGKLSRFLEPTTANFSAHSLELLRILFAAASEVDVVSKRLCATVPNGRRADNMTKYKGILSENFPSICGTVIEIPRYGLRLTPWEQWGTDNNPLWWKAYNNVKHHRHTHFPDANLQNALNAVAALFILLLFFYNKERRCGALLPDPLLFRAGIPFRLDRLMWEDGGLLYTLPGEQHLSVQEQTT